MKFHYYGITFNNNLYLIKSNRMGIILFLFISIIIQKYYLNITSHTISQNLFVRFTMNKYKNFYTDYRCTDIVQHNNTDKFNSYMKLPTVLYYHGIYLQSNRSTEKKEHLNRGVTLIYTCR